MRRPRSWCSHGQSSQAGAYEGPRPRCDRRVRDWDNMLNRVSHAIPLCFEIAEVEEFVLLDRSSNAGTVLFQFNWRLGAGERVSRTIGVAVAVFVKVVTRIKSCRAAVGIGGAVNGICA